MSLQDKKISESEKNQYNVKSVQGSRLGGTVQENKNVFDRLGEFFAEKYNALIDELLSGPAAGQIGSTEIGELKDPQDAGKLAKSVWQQIKALALLIAGLKANQDTHEVCFDNPHSVTKVQVGLGNVSDVLQASKTEFDALAQRMAMQEDNYSHLGSAAHKNADNTPGNVPLVGTDGKIDGGILPSIAFNDVRVFPSIAVRDAWKDAREGDAAIVTDDNAYMCTNVGWVPIPHPTDLVSSVAGRTGDVKLTVSDIKDAVAISDIIDNRISTEPRKPLSAHMGYLLDYDIKDLLRITTDRFTSQDALISLLQRNKAEGAGVMLRMNHELLEYRDQTDSQWHSQNIGPQGPQGVAGGIGPQGPQGIAGREGAQGTQGMIGPQGIQGIQGIQGDRGEKGDRGDSGITASVDSFYTMYVDGAGNLVVSMPDESVNSPFRIDANGQLIYTVS